MDILKNNLSTTSATSGIAYTFDENTYVTELAGQEYTVLSLMADYGVGIMLYQDFFVRKVDNRMISVTFSYREDTEADLEALMNAFAPY